MTLLIIHGLVGASLQAESRGGRAYNEFMVDRPFDGGGLVTYSRMWPLFGWLHTGFFLSGGLIERDLDLRSANMEINARTKAVVAPFLGPRVTISAVFLGVSFGYGLFWAKTDFDVDWPGGLNVQGETKGWGSALYSPLLVVDLYNTKRNIVFGVGLGGLLGTSYPTLEATGPSVRVTTTESPVETLTFHIRALWGDTGDGLFQKRKREEDDF